MRYVILFYFVRMSSEGAGGGRGGGGGALPVFSLSVSFPCSEDHERDWPPSKVVFVLATNTPNVRNNNNNNNSNNCDEIYPLLHYDAFVCFLSNCRGYARMYFLFVIVIYFICFAVTLGRRYGRVFEDLRRSWSINSRIPPCIAFPR